MALDRKDVDVRTVVRLYEGAFRADRFQLRFRRFDGTWSHEVGREVFDRGHAVAVLPYDPERDEVVIVEQFRAGPFAAGDDPWILEIVAGAIETGEAPDEVARRECREETGLAVARLDLIAAYYPSPGSISEHMHLYAARVDTRDAGGTHGLADEGEDIRVHVVASATAFADLDSGRYRSGPIITALNWLRANRERLRREWGGGPVS
ncbi:MAG: NUDIX domain-containing protein [Proteobacteria bacterium]|nr:NUDIX domain-containing protein [Pseudomonadota bacterium]